jgi:hypothetical protein
MNGLEVDLGNFNSITLDSENDKLTVGGGTKFSGFINLLYDAGKELREWLTRDTKFCREQLKHRLLTIAMKPSLLLIV